MRRVKFALEVHPTEIAFDIYTAEMAIDALDGREEFGFNFDPSHLHWQGVDPVKFLYKFPIGSITCISKMRSPSWMARPVFGSHINFATIVAVGISAVPVAVESTLKKSFERSMTSSTLDL